MAILRRLTTNAHALPSAAMHIDSESAMPRPGATRLCFVAAILFVAYHLPEWAGEPMLLLLFPLLAWWGSQALGCRGMQAWYLDARPGWLRLLTLGLAMALAVKLSAVALGVHGGVYRFGWVRAEAGAALAGTLGFMVLSTCIASISEDILTRGLVLRALPKLAWHPAIIPVSAALYVLNHIHRLERGPAEWLMLFCFGLAYGAALYRARSLWAAVGLHWGWNLGNGALDAFGRVELAQPALAPFYSSAAHLVLLAGALAWMGTTRTRQAWRLA